MTVNESKAVRLYPLDNLWFLYKKKASPQSLFQCITVFLVKGTLTCHTIVLLWGVAPPSPLPTPTCCLLHREIEARQERREEELSKLSEISLATDTKLLELMFMKRIARKQALSNLKQALPALFAGPVRVSVGGSGYKESSKLGYKCSLHVGTGVHRSTACVCMIVPVLAMDACRVHTAASCVYQVAPALVMDACMTDTHSYALSPLRTKSHPPMDWMPGMDT
eukprot:1160403-Pelagomonas_calceolata.AAC.11